MLPEERQNAIKFLESLQRKYLSADFPVFREDQPHIQDLTLPKLFEVQKKNYPGMSYEEYKKRTLQSLGGNKHRLVAFDSLFQDKMSGHMLSSIVDYIEPVVRKRYGAQLDQFIFGSLPFGHVNGCAYRVPDSNVKLIVLIDGVFGFVNLFTKGIGALFDEQVHEVNGEKRLRVNLEPESIQANLKNNPDILNRIFELIFKYLVYGNPFLSEQYFFDGIMYKKLLQSVETFLVAHEFGHIVSGHLDDPIDARHNESQIELQHLQEHDADHVGVSISMQVGLNQGSGTPIGYAGGDFFFCCMILVERCLSILQTGTVSSVVNLYDTHPPFQLRRLALRESLKLVDKHEVQHILSLSQKLEWIMENIFAALKPRFLQVHQKGIKPHEMWK